MLVVVVVVDVLAVLTRLVIVKIIVRGVVVVVEVVGESDIGGNISDDALTLSIKGTLTPDFPVISVTAAGTMVSRYSLHNLNLLMSNVIWM